MDGEDEPLKTELPCLGAEGNAAAGHFVQGRFVCVSRREVKPMEMSPFEDATSSTSIHCGSVWPPILGRETRPRAAADFCYGQRMIKASFLLESHLG